MSLAVDVSATGHSVVITLSGRAEAAALEGLRAALYAALGEGQTIVLDARALCLVGSAGLGGLLSGLGPGHLYLVGHQVPDGLDCSDGAFVAVHATVEEALAAIGGRSQELDAPSR